MTPSIYAKLRAIIDGDVVTLTPDDAKTMHAALWDARGTAKRAAALDDENNRLVAGILAEERRAVMAEILRADAIEIVRDGVNAAGAHNPARWRERAARWLNATDPTPR